MKTKLARTKALTVVLMVLLLATCLAGCRKASRIAYNISKQADNFGVVRRLTVINARTDAPLFELIGSFSLANNSAGELEVICQTGPNEYKKHFIYINREWTMYVVEDISGANVNPYQYEINFFPSMIVPFDIQIKD